MRGGIHMYNQRDIILMPFPYSDLTSNKVRPALIISNSNLHNDKICMLVTSKKSHNSISIKDNFLLSPLPLESYVKPHRIFTISEEKIIKKISSITPEFHKELLKELEKITK